MKKSNSKCPFPFLHHPNRDDEIPIPSVLSFSTTFIDDDLSEEEYRREVKKLIRADMKAIIREIASGQKDEDDCNFITEYDSRVWELIREVFAEN